MELVEYFNIIKKRLLLVILVTIGAAVLSGVLSYFVITPSYKSDISVIIGKPESKSAAPQDSYNDVIMYQKLVKTYSEFSKSRKVSEHVIKALKLNIEPNQLQGMISVAPKGDTEFLTITVKSKDPKEAMNIANQLAKSLKYISNDVKKVDNVQLLDEALQPTRPDSPNSKLNIAIAFFIGLMVSLGIAFLLEYLDNTVKSQEDIEKLTGLPVIGIIPLTQDKK
ncbi:lipopolysaccharide biosynthesis protein [Clostridium sp. CM027]|uniref:YveK family protein n=1 Tax=Clostridium sp. CM027 TaxID=2849865 RepID=UPI001C6F0799|nr:Wzz/FepE/Etk N-terminal domain-containing protein [Clostridium sp. CM027]MBW9146114.1 lipopolysaccharide biosynthesis protein [Clostridium sp. CM027]UVE41709.1 lipopolysaccharide biosynthesis protein [Clostridium sp. CM027]